MQSIQLIFDDAPENIQVPGSLRHQKVEVTFRALDEKNVESTLYNEENINSLCGVLQAPYTVSLEQMDKAVKQRGGCR